MTNSRYYEKLWHDILNDPKLGPLNDALKWRFVSLILAAGISREGGLLPPLPDLAWLLRVSEEQLRNELPALAQRELVELRSTPAGDRWHVTNYAKRQTAMSSAERVKRHRAASSASAASNYSFSDKEEEEDRAEVEIEVDKVTHPVTNRYTSVTAKLLAEAGISRNRTTAPLWSLDPEYVAAHLQAAPSNGLAITRMLAGETPPAGRKRRTLADQVPTDYAHLVER